MTSCGSLCLLMRIYAPHKILIYCGEATLMIKFLHDFILLFAKWHQIIQCQTEVWDVDVYVQMLENRDQFIKKWSKFPTPFTTRLYNYRPQFPYSWPLGSNQSSQSANVVVSSIVKIQLFNLIVIDFKIKISRCPVNEIVSTSWILLRIKIIS